MSRLHRDRTRKDHLHHLQNWRGDVVRLSSAAGDGRQVEGARFSFYGVPWGIAKCDIDGDGDVDTDDGDFMLAWSGVPASYDVRGDFDLDGDVDMNDEIIFNGSYEPALGWGKLSNFASRKGYAGYEHDGNFDTLAHVRNRVYASEMGRWTRRDPARFVDGIHLYQYVQGEPIAHRDFMGLRCGPIGIPEFDLPLDPFDGGPEGPGCQFPPCIVGCGGECGDLTRKLDCKSLNDPSKVRCEYTGQFCEWAGGGPAGQQALDIVRDYCALFQGLNFSQTTTCSDQTNCECLDRRDLPTRHESMTPPTIWIPAFFSPALPSGCVARCNYAGTVDFTVTGHVGNCRELGAPIPRLSLR